MKETELFFKCRCGTHVLEIDSWDDEAEMVFVAWRYGPETILNRIIGAWRILIGRSYLTNDFIFEKQQAVEIRDAITRFIEGKKEVV